MYHFSQHANIPCAARYRRGFWLGLSGLSSDATHNKQPGCGLRCVRTTVERVRAHVARGGEGTAVRHRVTTKLQEIFFSPACGSRNSCKTPTCDGTGTVASGRLPQLAAAATQKKIKKWRKLCDSRLPQLEKMGKHNCLDLRLPQLEKKLKNQENCATCGCRNWEEWGKIIFDFIFFFNIKKYEINNSKTWKSTCGRRNWKTNTKQILIW